MKTFALVLAGIFFSQAHGGALELTASNFESSLVGKSTLVMYVAAALVS